MREMFQGYIIYAAIAMLTTFSLPPGYYQYNGDPSARSPNAHVTERNFGSVENDRQGASP